MNTTSLRTLFTAILGFAVFIAVAFVLTVSFADPAIGMTLAFAAPALVRGSDLSEADQKKVLDRFSARYTGDHTPEWVQEAEALGVVFPVQFKTDQEFLSRTKFAVTKDGNLTSRKSCEAMPTWPNGKKVRTATEAERVAAAKAEAEAEVAKAEAEEAAALADEIEASAKTDDES